MANFAVMCYLFQVRRYLPCSGKTKNQIMAQIRNNVSAYAAENPSVSHASLIERFGSPRQIASMYIDERETSEILNALRIKQKILGAVIAAAAVMVTLWCGVMAYEIYYNANIANGYFSVTTESVYQEATEPAWR